MILPTEESLTAEYKACKEYSNLLLGGFAKQKSGYTGTGYRTYDSYNGSEARAINPENHAFEWLSYYVPQMTFTNPRVKINSRRGGPADLVATALQSALNQWIVDSSLYLVNRDWAYDFGFNWAVACITREPSPWTSTFTQRPMWPVAKRIAQDRFYYDPEAANNRSFRVCGHDEYADKEDLVAHARQNHDEGWDLDALMGLASGRREDTHTDNAADRGEVGYTQMWLPDVQVDEDGKILEYGKAGPPGTHGSIWTMSTGMSDSDDWVGTIIRRAYPFFGPRQGPYVMWGAHVVPNEPAPLSPLTAVESQARELNTFARAMSRAGRKYKRLVAVGGGNTNLAQMVRSRPDLDVFEIPGLLNKDQVMPLEIAGITPQHIEQNAIHRDRLDRVSGLSEQQRAQIRGGGTTATEVAVADRAGEVRSATYISNFRDGIREVLKRVAWYLYHDDEMSVPIGREMAGQVFDAEGMPILDPVFTGGMPEEGSGYQFEDLELDIEPYSMGHVSDAQLQRRVGMLNEHATNIVPMIPMTVAYYDWKGHLDMVADLLNLPAMSRFVNIEAAAEVGQMQMAAATEGQPNDKPRLGRQVGGTAVGRAMGNKPPPPPQSDSPSFEGRSNGRMLREETKVG